MHNLTVAEYPRSLELYSSFGYRVAGWIIGSPAKHERRQEIACFLPCFGPAPRCASRMVGACHRVLAGCVSPCHGSGDVGGRGVPRASRSSPLGVIAFPRGAHGRRRARRLAVRPRSERRLAADRVEWSFKLNPYAGGEVRSFVRSLIHERSFGARRPITIEARLYLNGQYQTLVEAQAIVQGGTDDPDLAAAVTRATQNLLGPSGAYRAIDTGQHPASRAQ